MKKIDEIKQRLGQAIDQYDNLKKEGKMEEARGMVKTIQGLNDELNEERIADAARREVAVKAMSEKEKQEIERFSFSKFVREANKKNLTGFESEMAQEARREARDFGITVGDYAIPYAVLAGKRALVGQNVTNPTDGGALVVDGGLTYVDALRNKLLLTEAGATMLTGLTGNVPLVYGTKFAGEWLEEGGESTIEKLTFTSSVMKPKRLSIQGAYSNQLLAQSSIDVERLVMNELIAAHAEKLNEAAINGSGTTPEPMGLLNMSGIGQVVGGENGAALTWKHIVDLETEVAVNNADLGTLAYVTNARVRGAMKTTEKANGQAVYLMEGGLVNGYKTVISNLVPKNLKKGSAENLSAMIFGNFADLLIGWWGGLDILADPYTHAGTDQVRVIARAFHDVSVRRKESFAVIKDIIA